MYSAWVLLGFRLSLTRATPIQRSLHACRARGPPYPFLLRKKFMRPSSSTTAIHPHDNISLSRIFSAIAAGLVALGTVVTSPPTPAEASRGMSTAVISFVDPSGQTMPVGSPTGWRKVFSDNFATAVPLGSFPKAVSNKWDAYLDGWKDTSRNGTYSPSKVISVRNGLLNMYLHTENGVHMVSAPVPKIPGVGSQGGLLYGRYAVRYRTDAVAGYKVAWLLWPDSENWSDGEIDFPEGNLNQKVEAFMHYRNAPTSQDGYRTSATFTSWHTAVVEWTPKSVKFMLDGATIGTSTDPTKIPNKPMHWVLQTETALDGTVPSNTAAGNVQIDWVAAYARV